VGITFAGGAHGDARAALDGAWDAIRAVAILPGAAEDATAELVAFLASKAGAYYSGCAFTLR
jgi:hypothetical protein